MIIVNSLKKEEKKLNKNAKKINSQFLLNGKRKICKLALCFSFLSESTKSLTESRRRADEDLSNNIIIVLISSNIFMLSLFSCRFY